LEKENGNYWRTGFFSRYDSRSTQTHQRARKENKLLREIVIQKKIERRVAKKEINLGEKKEIVRSYIFQGLEREVAFRLSGITKHQYY